MKLNYDLIIIGITKIGQVVGEDALKLGARVAIIDRIDENEQYWDSSLLSRLNQDNILQIEQLIRQENQLIKNKLTDLQLLGLDIYHQSFCCDNSRKIIHISTSDHELFSPVSVIALSRHRLFSPSPSSQMASIYDHYLGLHSLNQGAIASIIIKGNSLESIYLSQNLLYLDKPISLLTQKQQLLPEEDEDISWNLQLILESQGIKIFNHHSQLLNNYPNTSNENKNHLIIDTGKEGLQTPKYLSNLGIRWRNCQIQVNPKLQTPNPKIYSCGEILGGYNLDILNEYEAKIAVNNSLLFPVKTVDYFQVGYVLNTNPPLYRIGYTEKQILQLAKQSFYSIKIDSIFNYHQYSDFIKLIISKDDSILGFHGLGKNLQEIFDVICYMVNNNLKINYLFKANFNQIYSYKIVKKIEKKWLEENKRQTEIIINVRQTFLLWKRP